MNWHDHLATVGEPREFLLLASYCGNDNRNCTDKRPCSECLAMCNVFDDRGNFLRELGEQGGRRRSSRS